MSKKFTTEEFIVKAKLSHGDRYDYSLVEYIGNRLKVKILCKKHGEFLITPEHHVNRNQGCAECKKLGLEGFIEKSKLIFGEEYDYSLVKYTNNKAKINIICKEHGIFERRIADHLSGVGCPECAYDKFRTSTEDFIKKAKIKHNDKYDYPQNIFFKSNKEKVEIICKIHGSFFQKVNSHLSGQGCPMCKESKGEIEISNFLKSKKIIYLPQHKFENCKNINQLSFDFYLPELNICIEYNGKQHYEPIEFFGGINKFNQQIINDKIKKEYCYDNSIPLIIIKYDENVIDILGYII